MVFVLKNKRGFFICYFTYLGLPEPWSRMDGPMMLVLLCD